MKGREDEKLETRKQKFKSSKAQSMVKSREKYAKELRKKKFSEAVERKRQIQGSNSSGEDIKKRNEELKEYLRAYDVDLISPFLTSVPAMLKP